MKSEDGFVLVTALLLLFLFSTLVFVTMESVLKQYRLLQISLVHQRLYFMAEQGIAIGEKQLKNYSTTHLSVKVWSLSQNKNQDLRYKISSLVHAQSYQLCLQSVVEVTADKPKRIFWQQSDGEGPC